MGKAARAIVVSIVLIILGVFVVWIDRQPARPNVSIAFLGYTNNLSGQLVAQFSITNLNSAAAQIYSPVVFGSTAFYGYSPPTSFFNFTLPGRASKTVVIPAPTNQPEWKLQVLCFPNVGASRMVRDGVANVFVLFHMSPPYQTMPYSLQSDWIRDGSGATNKDITATSAHSDAK